MFQKTILTAGLAVLASLSACSGEAPEKQGNVRIGVLHCCAESDAFLWDVSKRLRSNLKELGVSREEFHNSEGSQSDQLRSLESMAKQSDVVLVSYVIDDSIEQKHQREILAVGTMTRTPVVFYTVKPRMDYLHERPGAYYVGSQPEQAGIMQGEMIARQWKEHPEWDKNGDGVIQYAIVKGPAGNPDAEARTKWVRATIDSYPTLNVKGELVEVASSGTWDRLPTVPLVEELLTRRPDLEIVASNNDEMALGAIEALKKANLKLPVFGVDGTPDALKAVAAGDMSGTLKQDAEGQARAAARLALNLATGRRPDLDLDEQLINHIVYTPYQMVDSKNVGDLVAKP